MPGRIHLLIGGHLSTAPRAQKEALALMEAGHEVKVSGIWFDQAWISRDVELISRTGIQFLPALDFRGGTFTGGVRRLKVRLQSRWARENFLRRGQFSPALLGYGVNHLLRAACSERADLTIVHSEAGLWVARELLRRGRGVGIDFEDWFSHDLPEAARRARPIRMLEMLEAEVARNSPYVLATSHAMAGALAAAYKIPPPIVVYNAFPDRDLAAMDGLRKDRLDPGVPSLHWFSQTLGPDRGLDLLFAALSLLKNPALIYLRGACSPTTRQWMAKLIPPTWRHAVHVLPLVANHELLSRIAEHDIGLALELPDIPNHNLTVSNKLFQYLLSGLAVIATDTQGQREVLSQCGAAGTLLPATTAEALAGAIDHYLGDRKILAKARQAARIAAAGQFSWEAQKARLVAQAKRALSAN